MSYEQVKRMKIKLSLPLKFNFTKKCTFVKNRHVHSLILEILNEMT